MSGIDSTPSLGQPNPHTALSQTAPLTQDATPAAATNNNPHTHIHTHASHTHRMLANFVQSATFVKAIDAARKRFLDSHSAWRDANTSLERLQSTASRNNSGRQLPRSIRLDFTTQVKFPKVVDNPAFFKEQIDALEKLELDTANTIYRHLLEGRTKLVKHLKQQSNKMTFISREMNTFRDIVNKFADQHDDLTPLLTQPAGPATDTQSQEAFPRKEALQECETLLHKLIDDHIVQLVDSRLEADAAKQSERDADMAAQEQVLNGAHNGQTIQMIAQRAIMKHLEPLKQDIHKLKQSHGQKRKALTQPAEASSPPVRNDSTAARSSNNIQLETIDTDSSVEEVIRPFQRQKASSFSFDSHLFAGRPNSNNDSTSDTLPIESDRHRGKRHKATPRTQNVESNHSTVQRRRGPLVVVTRDRTNRGHRASASSSF